LTEDEDSNTLINKNQCEILISPSFAIGWAVCGRLQPGYESMMPVL